MGKDTLLTFGLKKKVEKKGKYRKTFRCSFYFSLKNANFAVTMWFEPVNSLDFILKGLVIGVVVSAPMGPVGILCIQRTLNKGRWYGFVTGFGAAINDLVYALITSLGRAVLLFCL